MARRRTSTAEDAFDLFHDVFMHVPSWACIPAALVAFWGLKLLIIKVCQGKTFLEPMAAQYGNWAAGLFAAIVILAGIRAEKDKRDRRRLLEKQQGIDTIRDLSWSDFELLVGEAYRRLGYEVTETGGGGADGGIDLKLRDRSGQVALVQCKQWRVYKVGVKPIRELYGILQATGAAGAIFVTSGIYTQEAKRFAQGLPLELVDGERLAEMIIPLKHEISSKTGDTGMSTAAKTITSIASSTDLEAQACPVCGSRMIKRTARKGPNAGAKFWGCSEYPKCYGIRNI